jgi:preprotein translocase SecE subunit
MITAKDAFDDMRRGYVLGTDDYMVKPVNVNEMVLRVGALLRRAQMINERRQVIGSTILECDSLTASSEKNIVGKFVEYIKNSYNELVNEVTWPTSSELANSAVVVLVASLLIALLIFGIDQLFFNLMRYIYGLFS